MVAPTVYAEAPVVREIRTTEPAPDPTLCSCVLFGRTLDPRLPLGDAEDLVPNSPYPRVGGFVIIVYGTTTHVAYIYDKVSVSGEIPLHDGNFKRCEETWHSINMDDPRIKGYWSYPD